MKQIHSVRSRVDSVPVNSAARYVCPLASMSFQSTEFHGQIPWPVEGYFSNLVWVLGVAPGSGNNWNFRFRKNGANGNQTVTISDADLTGRDITNTDTVAVGDLVSLLITPTSSPDTSGLTEQMYASLEFTSTNPFESGYVISSNATVNSATSWNGVFTGLGWGTTDGTQVRNVVAARGSLTYSDYRLSVAPGAGKSFVFNKYVNGVKQDGSGSTVDTTITIADTATSGSLEYDLPLQPGDIIWDECVPSGTPTASNVIVGHRFHAAIDGESQMSARILENLNTVNTRFAYGYGRDDDWDGTEELGQLIYGRRSFSISGMQVSLTGAPGSGNSYTFSVRKNGASPAGTPSVAISGTDTDGEDLTGTVTIEDGDEWTVRSVPASGPDAQVATWSFIQTDLGIDPPGTPGPAGFTQLATETIWAGFPSVLLSQLVVETIFPFVCVGQGPPSPPPPPGPEGCPIDFFVGASSTGPCAPSIGTGTGSNTPGCRITI